MNEKETIMKILQGYRTVAIVGLSRNSGKASYIVADYLKKNGYNIIPVNPYTNNILDEKCYKSLLDIPEDLQKKIEIVDIFRPSHETQPIIDQALQLKNKHDKPCVIWMQLGIINIEAAKRAREAGILTIMNKCMKIEHQNLRI
jgi:predicted CoA-binding protein